eukprot:GHVP01033791.1.p1 GENE.GHVP01033791.1~~GHVP01033791.1.p1  ORF type:complete len:208 (+),score=34.48 GHVP01033791.1:34-624(+)
MGKINRELLTASGVQAVFNFILKEPPVDFKCNDLLLGDFGTTTSTTISTDQIQVRAYKQRFLAFWKSTRSNIGEMYPGYNPVSERSEPEAFDYFNDKLRLNGKIPFLPGILDLDENASLHDIMKKSQELKFPVTLAFQSTSEKKIHQVAEQKPTLLWKGPHGKYFPAWRFNTGDNDKDSKARSIHPCLRLNLLLFI